MTEGLRIGGASLALANNDLEEASSLIISGTEILRDSNMVANGLKTISMRIKGLADENGELAVGLEDTVKILTGVDLKDPNNEFRSTYDILKDIGEVWNDLSDLDKATLAEDIAGKNRVTLAPYVQKCA